MRINWGSDCSELGPPPPQIIPFQKKTRVSPTKKGKEEWRAGLKSFFNEKSISHLSGLSRQILLKIKTNQNNSSWPTEYSHILGDGLIIFFR